MRKKANCRRYNMERHRYGQLVRPLFVAWCTSEPPSFPQLSLQSDPNTSVEAEEHHSRPAVHRKEVGLVVDGHSRQVVVVPGYHNHLVAVRIVHAEEEAVHIVHGSERAVHIVPGLEEAVHIVPGLEDVVHIVLDLEEAVHSLAEEGHHSSLEEARPHTHLDRPGVVLAVSFSHLWCHKLNR
jgi:hypothetical protein